MSVMLLVENVFAIGLFSIVATLLRQLIAEVLLSRLVAPLFPELAANFLGCIVMGFGVNLKDRIIQWTSSSFYLGLTTGFCGSLTTLSTWAVFNAKLLVPDINFLFCITSWIIGLAVALFGFHLGQHISAMIEFYIKLSATRKKKHVGITEQNEQFTNSLTEKTDADLYSLNIRENEASKTFDTRNKDHPKESRSILILFVFSEVILVTGCLVSIVLDPSSNRKERYWMPGLCAGIGALLRWQISKLNAIKAFTQFPIGTFTANTLATIVSAICSGNIAFKVKPNTTASVLVLGISAGFCGCLSTVSTWISELVITLKPLTSVYSYALVTILSETVLASLLYGAFVWNQ